MSELSMERKELPQNNWLERKQATKTTHYQPTNVTE